MILAWSSLAYVQTNYFLLCWLYLCVAVNNSANRFSWPHKMKKMVFAISPPLEFLLRNYVLLLNTCMHSIVLDLSLCSLLFSIGELGLRLVNSSNDLSKGLLEVYYEGQWHSVCADSFTPADSSAACRQLGFSDGEWDPANIASGKVKTKYKPSKKVNPG